MCRQHLLHFCLLSCSCCGHFCLVRLCTPFCQSFVVSGLMQRFSKFASCTFAVSCFLYAALRTRVTDCLIVCMCVCVRVCVCMCVWVCSYACVRACVWVWVYVHVCLWVCVCMYVWVCVYMCVCVVTCLLFPLIIPHHAAVKRGSVTLWTRSDSWSWSIQLCSPETHLVVCTGKLASVSAPA